MVNNKSNALHRVVIGALAASILMAGCSTIQVGREFNYENFSSQVKPGTTDLNQVQKILGPPIGKGLVAEADGSLYDQWTYYYGNGNLGNSAKSKFKLLQIRFDPSGKVASYNWSGDLNGAAPVDDKSSK